MTQAQLGMQNLHSQLEQQTNTTEFTTQPLFNDSPVLFLEPMERDSSIATSEQTSSEKIFQHTKNCSSNYFKKTTFISRNQKL